MKATVSIAVRVVALAVLYFILFAASSAALLSPPSEQSTSGQAGSAIALLTVSIINTAVWAYVILRSRWAGWKLIVSIFFVF